MPRKKERWAVIEGALKEARELLPPKKERMAMIEAALFAVVGLALAWFAKAAAEIDGDAVLVALLVVPIVTYTIMSGRLSELKAGGLEAKFVSAIRQRVDDGLEVVPVSLIEKGTTANLQKWLASIDFTQPIILSLTMGASADRYNRDAILHHISILSKFSSFKFVVIRDQSE